MSRGFLSAVAGLLSAIFLLVADASAQLPGGLAPGGLAKAKSDFFVPQSCNGGNCHGSKVDRAELWNRSGDIWLIHDPHRTAYDSLLTPESLEIVRRFWSSPEGPPAATQDPEYRRFLEANCVACHASELAPISQRELGVDCQSCHGSASVWGDSHYSATWQALKAERFKDPSASGRINTESQWVTAQVCGSCHVGQMGREGSIEFDDQSKVAIEQREVSHRLMAAGHPPTYFELGHFLRRYPKHWWDQDNVADPGLSKDPRQADPSPIAGRSLDTWRIGKIVNAKQRLELLGNRLGKPEWPELTEHRCTSCHHPIDSPLKQGQGKEGRRIKEPFAEWDGWYLEQVDLALAITEFPISAGPVAPADPFQKPLVQDWIKHRAELQALLLHPLALHNNGSQDAVRLHCNAMLEILSGVITSELPLVDLDPVALRDQLKKAWAQRIASSVESMSWESAVQVKLAAQAIDPAMDHPVQDWDLPKQMWKRAESMPYKASRKFDWNKFYEQVQEQNKP